MSISSIDSIEVEVIVNAKPIVLINRKRLKMSGDALTRILEKMVRVIEAKDFPVVMRITALDGVLTQNTIQRPARSLSETVSFSTVYLQEIDQNTNDHHHTDRVFPVLALLLWQQSEHFWRQGTTNNFKCCVCGRLHYAAHKNQVNTAPDFCASDNCYSHTIREMLEPEKKTVKVFG